MQTSICASALSRDGLTMALRMSRGVAPAVFATCDVAAAGSVTSLAIDPFRQRILVDRLGKRLVMAGRDLRIPVVAEHALVGDRAAEAIVIGTVVTRIHRPVASLFGVPGQRKLDQRVAAGPMQICASVIAGAHDEVDALFHDVDFPAREIDLMAALIILAIAQEHREIAV